MLSNSIYRPEPISSKPSSPRRCHQGHALKNREQTSLAVLVPNIASQLTAREAQNDVAEIVVRAERRLGEMLAEQPLNGGDRKAVAAHLRVTLNDLGIN